MKMHRIYIVSLLIGFILLSSCEEFLNRDPEDKISNRALLKDIEGINYALAGTYNYLANDEYYRKSIILFSELKGGNVKFSNDVIEMYHDEFSDSYNYLNAPDDDDMVYYFYKTIYEVLNQTNNIIHALPDCEDGSEEEKNHIRGEALTIRALCHFDLSRLFAHHYSYTQNAQHIGIVTVEKTPDIFDQPARSTVYEAYKMITRDLEEAIYLMENSSVSKSRYWVSATAARALLARVYLYMEDWNKAIEYSGKVIENSLYSLESMDNYLYSWSDNTPSDEDIWVIDNSYIQAESLSKYIGLPDQSDKTQMTVTRDLYNLYDDGDIRKSLFREFDGDTICIKHNADGNTESHIPLIRLAEMYLIRAEANARIGKEVQARSDLNTIMERANPNSEFPGFTGKELINKILEERRKELAIEGHLFFDLKRLGRDVVRNDFNGTENQHVAYPSHLFVLPIPKDEIDYNENMKQNEGY